MTKETKDKPLSVFDIVNNLNTKELGKLAEVVIEETYVPFIINRALSNTRDSVFFANEMNRLAFTDKDAQHDFYYYGLPKKKRYGKWHKKNDDVDTINIIKESYSYSYQKAKDALALLSDEEIKKLVEYIKKGGTKK